MPSENAATENKTWYCYTCKKDLETVHVNGYHFADRMMEDVYFTVKKSPDGTATCTGVTDDSKDYFEQFNTASFIKDCERYCANGVDDAKCPDCGDDVALDRTLPPVPKQPVQTDRAFTSGQILDAGKPASGHPDDGQEYGALLVIDGKVVARDFPIPSREQLNAMMKEMTDANNWVKPRNERDAFRFRMWRLLIEKYRKQVEDMQGN